MCRGAQESMGNKMRGTCKCEVFQYNSVFLKAYSPRILVFSDVEISQLVPLKPDYNLQWFFFYSLLWKVYASFVVTCLILDHTF